MSRSMPSRRDAREGFTLLEVLISVAILALGLSTVFGSSVFASRNTMHARMITGAALVARCRMTEAEAYLRANQLPETEQNLDDPPDMSVSSERCCEAPYTCTARVEKIELPQPVDVQSSAGDRLLSNAATATQGSSFTAGDAGAPNAISQLATAFGALGGGGLGGAGIGSSDTSGGVASALGSAAGGGSGLAGAGAPNLQSMASQLLAGVYPTVKPLLEAAIRKLTVNVSWREGSRTYGFDVIEYVTNPGQSMASGAALDQLNQLMGGGQPGAPGGTMGSGQNSAPNQAVPTATPSPVLPR